MYVRLYVLSVCLFVSTVKLWVYIKYGMGRSKLKLSVELRIIATLREALI